MIPATLSVLLLAVMPELGKYATTVLSAYGVSLAALAVLVWLSLRRAARVRAVLKSVEERQTPDA